MVKLLKGVIIGETITLIMSGAKLMRESMKNLTRDIKNHRKSN